VPRSGAKIDSEESRLNLRRPEKGCHLFRVFTAWWLTPLFAAADAHRCSPKESKQNGYWDQRIPCEHGELTWSLPEQVIFHFHGTRKQIRQVRYPAEADIVGRVTAVTMTIASPEGNESKP